MTTDNGSSTEPPRQHGVKGVYYGGEWLDIEDCGSGKKFDPTACDGCFQKTTCPRSRSRNSASKTDGTNRSGTDSHVDVYDVCIIGAGCLGACVARELSRYNVSILWVEAADDVSQGATKGNSGIVHAGYDDQPGSVRSQHCWPGNQMFAKLDQELRFGYQRNGSLVLAYNQVEVEELHNLLQRGIKNGVKNLRIITDKDELFQLEPHMNSSVIAALHAPDAGNVIPYEFAIALAENAVDNGVELRIRTKVTAIDPIVPEILDTTTKNSSTNLRFTVHLERWEPSDYINAVVSGQSRSIFPPGMWWFLAFGLTILGHLLLVEQGILSVWDGVDARYHMSALAILSVVMYIRIGGASGSYQMVSKSTPLTDLVDQAGIPAGSGGEKVAVEDMFTGGSGSSRICSGRTIETSTIQCSYIINCAGGASDQIANMIGDASFKIKPRLGDYILLNRNQGHLAKHTLFPCPDPVLGKGVLVQTTLWGNLILGPTARDTYKPEARDMSAQAVQEYILSQCKKLVPSFDAKETIHAFCGARAKSDRGDWIIEPSAKNPNFIHVAGIDSPGLAGAPSIALKVVDLLRNAGLETKPNPTFDPNRAPIITPKNGMKGLKMGPVGKFDSDGHDMVQMAANVICKCEKVTELEVVRAMRRSLPIDSSQAIRKRTRAGMGHCQGDPDNFQCEARVRAIIARENGVPISQVGCRPWPATSTLSQRWIDDREKKELEARMNK